MKLLKNTIIRAAWFVVLFVFASYQSKLINDPFLEISVIIIETIFIIVIVMRAKARIKAREKLANDQGV